MRHKLPISLIYRRSKTPNIFNHKREIHLITNFNYQAHSPFIIPEPIHSSYKPIRPPISRLPDPIYILKINCISVIITTSLVFTPPLPALFPSSPSLHRNGEGMVNYPSYKTLRKEWKKKRNYVSFYPLVPEELREGEGGEARGKAPWPLSILMELIRVPVTIYGAKQLCKSEQRFVLLLWGGNYEGKCPGTNG